MWLLNDKSSKAEEKKVKRYVGDEYDNDDDRDNTPVMMEPRGSR